MDLTFETTLFLITILLFFALLISAGVFSVIMTIKESIAEKDLIVNESVMQYIILSDKVEKLSPEAGAAFTSKFTKELQPKKSYDWGRFLMRAAVTFVVFSLMVTLFF